jgi:repressor LexA
MMRKNSKNLTQKQKKVYDYICNCLEKNNFSPTVLELAEYLCVSSLRTVTQYLESLEKKGLIIRSRHKSRGIRLAKELDLLVSTVVLPVVSAAGCDNLSVFAEQSFDEFITLDRSFLGDHKAEKVVVFRAMGNSMLDAGIETGDLVLTEVTNDIQSKDKVVAVIDGMAVIKEINFSPNAVILRPMSQDSQYRPIIMKRDFKVFGKVIEVIKGLSANSELTYESL